MNRTSARRKNVCAGILAVSRGDKNVASRWTRFYRKQMEDPAIREMVAKELENLRLGVQIAKLRDRQRLSQARLAARADMPGSKVSAIENSPRNLTVATLIRIAHALNRRLEIRFVSRKGRRSSTTLQPRSRT